MAAVVLVAASQGSSSFQLGKAGREINALLTGIPQSGNALGSSTAPVTLQFFGDLECSTAREFALERLPYVIHEWVRPGKVRIEFRSFRSVSDPKPFAEQQAAALAAGVQDKLWEYLEYFYREQGQEHSGYVTPRYLASLAHQVPGLNVGQWSEERAKAGLALQVSEGEQLGHAAHLVGTPSFLIGPTGSASLYSLGETTSLQELSIDLQRTLQSQRS